MKRRSVAILGAFAVMLPFSALAIDREAGMIDTFSFGVQDLDDMDGYSLRIGGETAALSPGQKWAVLFGAGMGEVSPTTSTRNISSWMFDLGMRYYLTPLTAISVIGHYDAYDTLPDKMDIKAGEVAVRQRFASASKPVSPFVVGSFTWRDRSTFSDIGTSSDSISEYLLSLGGGCEFHMGDNFAWVVQGAYIEAHASQDEAENLDGVMASVALSYYFMPSPR